MTKSKPASLDAKTVRSLTRMRNNLQAKGCLATRRKVVGDHFSKRNRQGNKTFEAVRDRLRSTTFSSRCCYCEDSNFETIDHFKPKSIFPGEAYTWSNYVASCATCNEFKGGGYTSFQSKTSTVVDDFVKGANMPKRKSIVINPRVEDGLEFMRMDLTTGTDYFEVAPAGTRNYIRAQMTLNLFQLNTRPAVPTHRKEALETYKIQLTHYGSQKAAGAPQAELDRLKDLLLSLPHRSVWRQMQIAHTTVGLFTALFVAAPEALAWS